MGFTFILFHSAVLMTLFRFGLMAAVCGITAAQENLGVQMDAARELSLEETLAQQGRELNHKPPKQDKGKAKSPKSLSPKAQIAILTEIVDDLVTKTNKLEKKLNKTKDALEEAEATIEDLVDCNEKVAKVMKRYTYTNDDTVVNGNREFGSFCLPAG